MYNKIRLGIMLISFTMVTLIGLSYSGNVSGTCRSEWNLNRGIIIKEDKNRKDVSTGITDKKRLPGFDLILTDFLLTF